MKFNYLSFVIEFLIETIVIKNYILSDLNTLKLNKSCFN